ncbi:MAG: uroporphyrinogen-III C-methyltransferase [Rubrivivax sp.]|nr:uroporphyrinogen-III C-methyltransferase [Rubrivivax sp.]
MSAVPPSSPSPPPAADPVPEVTGSERPPDEPASAPPFPRHEPGAGPPAVDGAAALRSALPRAWLVGALLLVLLSAGALWFAWTTQERMRLLEAELVRRQQESALAANEARVLARQAETAAREVAAKVALTEARVAETAMQRSQVEDLLQSLARSRDENVLADIEAAVRVAQQQSAITGSAEPLLLVLRQGEERLARYAQPRLERVRRAMAQDLERLRAAGGSDLAVLAGRIDDLVRQVDDLPMLAVPPQAGAGRRGAAEAGGAGAGPGAMAAARGASAAGPPASTAVAGTEGGVLATLRQAWQRFSAQAWGETRSLLRVTRIDQPEAMLVAPEQAYFLRANVKLRLLNARLALLARQFDVAQSDLRDALAAIERYFDRNARRTITAAEALRQVIAQARTVVLPRPDATFAAIAAASAGR